MNKPVYTEKIEHLTIEIYYDPDAQSPEENHDNGAFIAADHRQFSVRSEALGRIDELKKTHHILPLEAYIHSGVVLALSKEGNFPDRQWDVSQLGAVFLSKKEWKTKTEARQYALALIEEWNDYLSGNVYGYEVKDEKGNIVGNPGSCWGFYGDYDRPYGALDEARSSTEYVLREMKKAREAKLKGLIRNRVPLSKREGAIA